MTPTPPPNFDTTQQTEKEKRKLEKKMYFNFPPVIQTKGLAWWSYIPHVLQNAKEFHLFKYQRDIKTSFFIINIKIIIIIN